MNARTLYLLIGAAVLAVAIAVGINSTRQPRVNTLSGERLVPQLSGRINDVSAITIVSADSTVVATMKREKEDWTITEKGGYPADTGKIRDLLIKLDQARLLEKKTDNAQRYGDIGVEDVKSKDAKGVRVDLAGLGPQPVSVIIGNNNAKQGVGTFVRREGETQSWLASGSMTVTKNVTEWERRELADIPATRWKSVTLTSPDGKKIIVYKDAPTDGQYKLVDMPPGREPDLMNVNGLAVNLATLRAEDVFPAKEAVPPQDTYKAEYAAFNGLVVTAIAWKHEDRNFAQMKATVDRTVAEAYVEPAPDAAKDARDAEADKQPKAATEPRKDPPKDAAKEPAKEATAPKDPAEKVAAVQREADALNETFSGWTFVLPTNRFNGMRKTLEDMLEPQAVRPPPASAPNMSSLPPAPKPPAGLSPAKK